MNIELKGKRAIVCGATGGIGKACAITLANAGAHIVAISRNEVALKHTVRELNTEHGQQHLWVAADFSVPDFLKTQAERLMEKISDVHILVNNTGGPAPGSLLDAEPSEFINAFNSHLMCNHLLSKAFIPYMKEAGYGRIINIVSTSVKEPIEGLGVSNTIRGAVASWAKTLSKETAPYGITVNNILPGLTLTGRLQQIIELKAKEAGVSVDEMTERMQNSIPMKRFAKPEEPAALALFLASAYGAYVTGTSIAIDGGKTVSI